MNQLGQTIHSERPVYSVGISEYSSLSDLLLPSQRSVVFLASSASCIDTKTIFSAATSLLENGCVCICTWGDDCERVHDIFDDASVQAGTVEGSSLMSTWHSDESLSDAIDFFLSCAFPFDDDFDKTSYVAVAVGDQALNESLTDIIENSEHITVSKGKSTTDSS